MANLLHREETARSRRLHLALCRVYQALVRGQAPDQVFEQLCRGLVEEAGFPLAWVGWHDAELGQLVPVSRAGEECGSLDGISKSLTRALQSERPLAQALRAGRACVSADLLDEPVMSSLAAAPDRLRCRACAVFPIRAEGRVLGTLHVHSDRADFQDQEISFLTEAASDISIALGKLTLEAQRTKAHDAIKYLSSIIESTDDAIVSQTLDGIITSWNLAAQEMFGYSAEEAIGAHIDLVVPKERVREEPAIMEQLSHGHGVKLFETVRARKDGSVFPVSITYSPLWGNNEAGNRTIVGASKIVRDISARKRTEALAARERDFANCIIEAMPGVFYLYDEGGKFLRWNGNFERVSGYSADEIRGLHPLDFFSAADKAVVRQRIADVFTKGESSVEAPFITKDGRSIPYFFTGRRIVFDGSTCLIGVGVDITERKRAEEELQRSEERYRSTLDNTLEGCQLLDFDFRYLYLNAAASVHNRRPNEELLGRRMPDVWPGMEATAVFGILKRCMEERVALHDEVEFGFPDGSTGWFDVRSQPVPEGIFILSIDISERKAAEKALRELNEDLELKVRERTRDLEAARHHAEAADKIKSAFLATMSHELRTPLNSIIGFTGIVLQGMAGPLTCEQTKQLGMVQSSARHLLDLINDVLDISKIEAGELEVRPVPFDLKEAIERVAASIMPLVEKKGLSLKVVAPPKMDAVESDRRRVEQVLLNLLNNAIKFTQQGTITLEVQVVDDVAPGAKGARQTVHIAVADTGIGIDEANLALVFQPFRQIDTGIQRQHEGTGLGLAICRRLTELLGGTIDVESALGKGSVFTVRLPMKRT